MISNLPLNIDLRHFTSPPLVLCMSFDMKYTQMLLDGQVEILQAP